MAIGDESWLTRFENVQLQSLSENFEMQFNFGLKSALTPAPSGEGETVSVTLANHAFGWLKTVPR
jgi:hypothetical protein